MSKRGQILKRIKTHAGGFRDALKDLAFLPEKDRLWAMDRLDKWGKKYESQTDETIEEIQTHLAKEGTKDDLPF